MNCFSNTSRKFLVSKTTMLHKLILLFLLLFALVIPLYAEQEKRNFYIEPRLTTWGLYTDFCFRLNRGLFETTDTILRLNIGSVINWSGGYYRDEDDRYTDSSDLDYLYTRLDTTWGLGIEQGLIWNEEADKNLMLLSLRYRTMRVWHFNICNQDSILFDSIRPDKDGVLYNTFIISLLIDNAFFSRETGLRKGVLAELSAELGPEWFFNDIIGIADFTKIFANLRSFYPLYEAEHGKKLVTAVYFANSIGIDYVFGDNIPLPARQTFGVQRVSGGCGGRVRGFEDRRFDSEVKAINNFDIRLRMSQIRSSSGKKILHPGLLVFFDACYFEKLEGYKENGSGTIMSAGFALFSDFFSFGAGTGVLTVGFPLVGERIDKSPMTIKLDYGFRF